MIYYLLITAITVSIDSFLCGLSLSLGKKNKITLVSIITLTVFIMCLITNYGTMLIKNLITEKTASLGGVILISIGLFNLLKKEKTPKKERRGFIVQALSAGFAVGLDGAFANLSLSLMEINAFYVPVTIAVTHGLMILLSVLLSETKMAKKVSKLSFIGPVLLIILGLYKLLAML